MKKGWEIKKLEDVVEFQRGLTYSKKDEVDFSNNIVLRSNNIDLIKNELDFTELKYINPAIEVQENKKIKKGSLLICTANGSKKHLGKVALIDDEYNYAFGGFMGQVTPNERLDSKFLFYLMTSDNYKQFINELSDGANINNLKFSDLGQFKIPLPPLPEQQRIVSILDECFSAIERSRNNAEQNLKNAKEFFESYLQGVFEKKMSELGYKGLKDDKIFEKDKKVILQSSNPKNHNSDKCEVKKLSEVAKHSLGKMLDKNKNKGVPQEYLRNLNVRWFEFDLSDLNEMPFLETEKEKYTATKGDVMICEGGYPGRAAIWEEDYPIYFQKAVHRVRFHKTEYNKWFLYYLFHLDCTGKLKEHFTGAGIQHFTGQALGKLAIPIPPQNKVIAIVRQLDALRAKTQKLEALYQKKIDDLDELKKSILQKAFAGELHNGEPAEPKTKKSRREGKILENKINKK